MAGGGPRHGIDWGRAGVTPVSPTDLERTTSRPLPTTPSSAPDNQAKPLGLPRVLSVRTIDAFYETLPSRTIQYFSQCGQARCSASNLVAGGVINIVNATVPEKYVWVVTDAAFYGLCPSSHLEAPSVPVSYASLVGLLRFEITLGDRQPLANSGSYMNPYAAVSSDPNAGTTGWPFTETPLTSRGSFALYARSQQAVRVVAQVDVVPRFWLSVLGARLTGFTIPEVTFDEILRKQQRGNTDT